MVDIKLLLILLLQVHLSTQIPANLCFNRERNIDCSIAGRAFIGGIMDIRSVTILLSSDVERLMAHNDGMSCTAVEYECTSTIRESIRGDFQDRTIMAVYDYIMDTCHGKKSCDLKIPNWNSVNGTTETCRLRFPDISRFHLRGVFLDIECQLPILTTTPTVDANDTDSTSNSSTSSVPTTVSTSSRPGPTKDQPTSRDPAKKPTLKPTSSPILRKKNIDKSKAAASVNSAANHFTYLPLFSTLAAAYALLSMS